MNVCLIYCFHFQVLTELFFLCCITPSSKPDGTSALVQQHLPHLKWPTIFHHLSYVHTHSVFCRAALSLLDGDQTMELPFHIKSIPDSQNLIDVSLFEHHQCGCLLKLEISFLPSRICCCWIINDMTDGILHVLSRGIFNAIPVVQSPWVQYNWLNFLEEWHISSNYGISIITAAAAPSQWTFQVLILVYLAKATLWPVSL